MGQRAADEMIPRRRPAGMEMSQRLSASLVARRESDRMAWLALQGDRFLFTKPTQVKLITF